MPPEDRARAIVTDFRGKTFSSEEDANTWLLRRCQPNIFESDEDEGWIATVAALPGCSAFGATRDDAKNEICAAIEAWIIAFEGKESPSQSQG